MKKPRSWNWISLLAAAGFILAAGPTLGEVIKRDGGTFIVDQLGEQWEVTQAESLGFSAEKFQYGIGRNTFVTLDDSHLKPSQNLLDTHRVMGVAKDGEAHAYSVGKLARHEVANTTLGGSAVAGAY